MQLTAIIVDDEFPARAELISILKEIGGVDVVGECEDGDEVLQMIHDRQPDVVFLDIQMRNKSGLTVAGEIMELDFPPSVIFTTGFSQFAVQAFELNAVDYILKPYACERVAKCIDKLVKAQNANERQPLVEVTQPVGALPPSLCVWAKDRMIILRSTEIFFAKADVHRQTMLQTEQGALHTKLSLKELQNLLGAQGFLRTHKSYLVNLSKIREVIPWFNNTYVLVLENCRETNIPVARHYMKEFNKMMGIAH